MLPFIALSVPKPPIPRGAPGTSKVLYRVQLARRNSSSSPTTYILFPPQPTWQAVIRSDIATQKRSIPVTTIRRGLFRTRPDSVQKQQQTGVPQVGPPLSPSAAIPESAQETFDCENGRIRHISRHPITAHHRRAPNLRDIHTTPPACLLRSMYFLLPAWVRSTYHSATSSTLSTLLSPLENKHD
ncbi:hypothetical protein CABS03_03297 [Colletotrichum abscissum]|uniref:Uncharacterized protein n=1 Tax=Colletotrichum abscissum TaxID=1671311 RepID=A0A9Q0AXT0_9PEZI|nr:hypothetical protein CABS02_13551 [Colletotrichum abscissum]